MIKRVFVEKREGFRTEAEALCSELKGFVRISALAGVRLINRYDIEGISDEELNRIVPVVLAEPQSDTATYLVNIDTPHYFIIEYLPGQFDARAESAAQCISLVTLSDAPKVRSAKLVLLYGALTDADVNAIKHHMINPVEAREAAEELPKTLSLNQQAPLTSPMIEGFCDMNAMELETLINAYSLAMDIDDLVLLRGYFKQEHRDPTETELKVVDTYWSDHCRHTTFNTELCDIDIQDPRVRAAYEDYLLMREATGDKKPVTLMDIATMGARYNKKRGKLDKLDVSDEINACTVNTVIEVDGEKQDYKILFKNETHNHPTEIEPFGGAATCIGGCIRDPLSGRAEVYQAMRISGAGDPTRPPEDVLAGKLHQKTIVTKAAEGYSSYGNQIGLATGLVHEIYHEGYVAKHLELGAVIGACPSENVMRQTPAPDDCILLVGGRTGRDGCGGATGSSKKHDANSLTACGAEVQKGNAPEERKLQRLFMNKKASRLIKRCNDFGAGGVSVAIGELADGVLINLDAVTRKYEGLTPTELAISESQERMAVVVSPENEAKFMRLAREENIECTRVAVVTEEKRLKMLRAGAPVCDIAREFLDTNGAKKRADVYVGEARTEREKTPASLESALEAAAKYRSGKTCRGLIEQFDQTIGARTLLLPLGGRRFSTPAQVMAALVPVDGGTDACTVMSYGFDPELMESDPFSGAYASVMLSAAKIAASGAPLNECYLSFQEYFESMRGERERFGKPFSALLGALAAQKALGLSAIGGKDSMSGTYLNLNVPPTLVSFAAAITSRSRLISPEFKAAGHYIALFIPPEKGDIRSYFDSIASLAAEKKLLSAYAVERGGALSAVLEMSRGNGIGAHLMNELSTLSRFIPGSIVAELEVQVEVPKNCIIIGRTSENFTISLNDEAVNVLALERIADAVLEGVYKTHAPVKDFAEPLSYIAPRAKKSGQNLAAPRVIIPVFAGTNCEMDARRAFISAGARAELFIVNTLSPLAASESAKKLAEEIGKSQIVFLPGGFSYADEPDGSGKSIAAFFRNPYIMDSVRELLYARDGLMGGVCNGFQALIKLGLVPFGDIRETDENCPTLFKNAIGRHVVRMVYTRVASNASPWLMHYDVGDVELMPISHGEGRFICPEGLFKELAATGQIATQYCDGNGEIKPGSNPNGSYMAVEGLLSPDGRVFGRMAHAERMDKNLYINAPESFENRMFAGAVDYFRR